MKEKAVYDNVAALMGFSFHQGHEQSIPAETKGNLFLPNHSSQEQHPATENRWKAVLGSEAWRDFRRSRRRILRGTEGHSSVATEPSLAKETSKEFTVTHDGDGDALIKRDSALDELKTKSITETSLANERRKSGVSLAQRLLSEKKERRSVSFNDCDPPLTNIRRGSSLCSTINAPSLTSLKASETVILIDEVESLERLFDKQEDEIDELEDELARSKTKNRKLKLDFEKKQQAYRHLEEQFSKLKIELARSREGESDLQLEMSRLILVRDLENINMINVFNNLYLDAKALEKENENMLEKLQSVEKTTEEEETKLLRVLDEVIALKRERAQRFYSCNRSTADDSIMFSSFLDVSDEDRGYI
mmetsp:Transcript_17457/g.26506  ORF Transcript_17457/g.26506 Transcript_17457/m.26506 type:complete len:363 (+) Transcript_17457:62-1150(+)|eukprot:CAMPEP_0178932220 /NCGR_PEP_ID=MMETSP0786-20121207/22467_1 /TAXON_ID=186022 /ORGANISM="Thalassionema frauenfeldii, Strain CCMP 1798" /LENGTH=362 /DNA_ID=CAMNT_0020609429 /DNA_START=14 /DNA_END=1102 /DNA_ORIENTATION=-